MSSEDFGRRDFRIEGGAGDHHRFDLTGGIAAGGQRLGVGRHLLGRGGRRQWRAGKQAPGRRRNGASRVEMNGKHEIPLASEMQGANASRWRYRIFCETTWRGMALDELPRLCWGASPMRV